MATKMSDVLKDFVPAPQGEAQQKYLARLTKYEKAGKAANALEVEQPSRSILDDSTDIVAVYDPQTTTAALILRSLVAERQIGDGRTFRDYEVTAMRILGKGEEARDQALEAVAEIEAQRVAEIVSGIEGF